MPTKMVKNTLVEHATKTLLGAKGQIIKSAAQAETARAEAAEKQQQIELDKVVELSRENKKLTDQLQRYVNHTARATRPSTKWTKQPAGEDRARRKQRTTPYTR